MKLLGVIAVLAVVMVSCEKEDVRPNTAHPATPEKRMSVTNGGGSTEGTSGKETGAGTGIVDPNADTDASNGRKKGK
jgi:hypothetical protein